MRLREAGVSESTVSDVVWHSTRSMTHHYSVAQIVELDSALEQIKDDLGRWNKSLAMLKLEQKGQPAGASPAKVPHEAIVVEAAPGRYTNPRLRCDAL